MIFENQSDTEADHSDLMAGSLLGVANQAIEVAGRYLVGIKMKREFHEYGEIVETIEEHNEKNIGRLKLDEEDRTLLRPLLAAVVRKSDKAPSPEQQLVAVAAMILMKKGQLAMQIRSENKILAENIVELIRTKGGASVQDRAGKNGIDPEKNPDEEGLSGVVAENSEQEYPKGKSDDDSDSQIQEHELDQPELEDLSEAELGVMISGTAPNLSDFDAAGLVGEPDDEETVLRKLGEGASNVKLNESAIDFSDSEPEGLEESDSPDIELDGELEKGVGDESEVVNGDNCSEPPQSPT